MNIKTTKILSSQKKEHIKLAAQMLAGGNLVAFPTETVYGLGANGYCEAAIAKIFKAKGRPNSNPLILHVNSLDQALDSFDFTQNFNEKLTQKRLFELAKHFWPGPLTIICHKKRHIPGIVTAGLPKVAVRIPDHKVAQEIITLANIPIAAPSANASCRPSPTLASHVLTTLNGKIDALVDGGACSFGLESTVLDISEARLKILRLGSIKTNEIEQILQEELECSINTGVEQEKLSPGMSRKHYAPKISNIILCDYLELQKAWLKPGAILLKKSSAELLEISFGKRPNSSVTEQLPNNAKDFAKELYAAFYRLEGKNISPLFIEKPSLDISDCSWAAVSDKLRRAAA